LFPEKVPEKIDFMTAINFSEDFVFKFIRFCVVGFTGVFIDFGITFLCKEIIKIQKYVSNATGFTIAATSNYFLNRWWTFHSGNPDIVVEYSKFLFISIIGLGINMLILWILVSKYNRHFYLSKLFAIAIVTIWNFFANVAYTFC
jgi:putative flippase GtrA